MDKFPRWYPKQTTPVWDFGILGIKPLTEVNWGEEWRWNEVSTSEDVHTSSDEKQNFFWDERRTKIRLVHSKIVTPCNESGFNIEVIATKLGTYICKMEIWEGYEIMVLKKFFLIVWNLYLCKRRFATKVQSAAIKDRLVKNVAGNFILRCSCIQV